MKKKMDMYPRRPLAISSTKKNIPTIHDEFLIITLTGTKEYRMDSYFSVPNISLH